MTEFLSSRENTLSEGGGLCSAKIVLVDSHLSSFDIWGGGGFNEEFFMRGVPKKIVG